MAEEKLVTPISELGEFGLITELSTYARKRNESSKLGIGDDAAIIDHENFETVVTTDLLMEGIHFDLIYSPLKHLGYKAVVVNLSDVYAMFAEPKQITVSIAVSNKFSVEALKELYSGIEAACNYYQVDLVGGDTTGSMTGLAISITALGVCEKGKAIKRSSAQAGDYICVTGNLGAAYLGLQILEREKQIYLENKNIQPNLEEDKYVVERFLKPEARKEVVEMLKNFDITPTAMIDISDGLSSELKHICIQSQVGCAIFDENIPLHPETINRAVKFNIDPTTCALNGGEDYELLFTVNKKDLDKLEEVEDVKVIGRITEKSEGMKLVSQSGKEFEIEANGWQAFS